MQVSQDENSSSLRLGDGIDGTAINANSSLCLLSTRWKVMRSSHVPAAERIALLDRIGCEEPSWSRDVGGWKGEVKSA